MRKIIDAHKGKGSNVDKRAHQLLIPNDRIPKHHPSRIQNRVRDYLSPGLWKKELDVRKLIYSSALKVRRGFMNDPKSQTVNSVTASATLIDASLMSGGNGHGSVNSITMSRKEDDKTPRANT